MKKDKNEITFENTIRIQKIKEYMKKHNLTEEQFAQKCHLILKELQKVLHNRSYFEPIWVLKIARTMSVDFSDLVN